MIVSFIERLWQLLLSRKWQLLTLFVAVLVPLMLFGSLADEVIEGEPFRFDEPILQFAHSQASGFMDSLMILISRLGYGWGVVPFDLGIWFWLLYQRRLRDSAMFGLAVGGAGILNRIAKAFFGRERPKLWESVAPETTLSFPSGHAMGSMALMTVLIVLLWPTRWRYPMLIVGILFVGLVGSSRVYLGVHYPSDILAGWIASFAWVMGLSMLLYGRIGRPAPAQAQSSPVPVRRPTERRA